MTESERRSLITEIREAFQNTPRPERLVHSDEGHEPRLIKEEFAKTPHWSTLSAPLVDQSPRGLGSALSFFSPQAFRHYLPAYLIAELTVGLKHSDVIFHLTHGFTSNEQEQLVNRQRYGEKTWFQASSEKMAFFDQDEIRAIIGFLNFMRSHADLTDGQKARIHEALEAYWLPRLPTTETLG